MNFFKSSYPCVTFHILRKALGPALGRKWYNFAEIFIVNRPQWIMAGVALLAVLGLYAATSDTVFGYHPKVTTAAAPAAAAHTSHAGDVTIDSLLLQAQSRLTPQQRSRLNMLESG